MANQLIDDVARQMAQPNRGAAGAGIGRAHEAVWQAIDDRIQSLLDRHLPQVWSVGSLTGGLPTLDPDGGGAGRVGVPRMAGFQVKAGDRVMTLKTRSGARVVIGKIITGTGPQEAVVGSSELVAGGVRSAHIGAGQVTSTHIGSGQVNDGHITGMATAKLVGSISAGQISSVSASSVGAGLVAGQISSVNATAVQGILPLAAIPLIPPSKISPPITLDSLSGTINIANNTSGNLPSNRISGNIPAGQISGLNFSAISGRLCKSQLDSTC
jgi:hypothetical protein